MAMASSNQTVGHVARHTHVPIADAEILQVVLIPPNLNKIQDLHLGPGRHMSFAAPGRCLGAVKLLPGNSGGLHGSIRLAHF